MRNKNKKDIWMVLAFIVLIYAVVAVLEQLISPNHILFTVLKKAAVYSLVAVSMNLLNGFTGLFSLGQAGFMLLGAYTYAVFTLPMDIKLSKSVFVYFGCAIHFDTGLLLE
jgi:branched-chain amino acid transport system permease protein